MDSTTAQFIEQFGNDLFQDIFDSLYDGVNRGTVEITEKHRVNAINYDFSGAFIHEGKTWYFDASDGDYNGSVINSYGEDEPNIIRTAEVYKFVPSVNVDALSKEEAAFVTMKFNAMREQADFQEMQRKMNYDKHFAPGIVVDKHYGEWASKRGLRIICETVQVK